MEENQGGMVIVKYDSCCFTKVFAIYLAKDWGYVMCRMQVILIHGLS
jgi:hypothetical protein